jgi:hypothetical protein
MDNLSGGGGDNLFITSPRHTPLWHGGTPPLPPYPPLLYCQNVIWGGQSPKSSKIIFGKKMTLFEYLLNMKKLIKRLLKESLKDQLISSYEGELDDLISTHGDIIKRYRELTLLIDKLEYLDNIKYTVSALTNSRGIQNYNIKVKDPYAEGTKWINLHGGRKDVIDKMSPEEKESHFENRALTYLMKKIM